MHQNKNSYVYSNMQTMLQKILQESRFTPNSNLEHVLFLQTQKRINTIMRIKFAYYFTIGAISSFSLAWYLHTLYIDLGNSGVYSYFNLILGEDMNTLFIISEETLYAIAESLPLMSMTLSLGLLFMVMFSANGVLISLQRKHIYNTN